MEKKLIDVKLSKETLSTMIAGLYCSHTGVDPMAIPTSMYFELGEILQQYLPQWNYDEILFEDWVKNELIIAPIGLFNEEELENVKSNTIYIERTLGNVVLVATGEVHCCE